jgi:signal transduction histidine kinase
METQLSPRLTNLILGCLAGILAAAILGIAIFIPGRWSPAKIQDRVEKNCERMEAALAGEVEKCVLRSDALRNPFLEGKLAAADLAKKEALIIEKNGIITGYIGEIYYFKPLTMPNGEWRLIKKNQDVYFLRRIGPQAFYVRFFMDMRSNPIRRAQEYPYPVFDLKYSNVPLPPGPNDFSYDRAQDRFYYTRFLKPSQNQLVVTLVFARATFIKQALQTKKTLIYGLLFLLFLTAFLALAQAKPFHAAARLLALAGMAFALWWGMAWLALKNTYFPRSPLAVGSVFQLLVLLIFILACFWLCRKYIRLKNNTVALIVFNVVALAAFFAADRVLRNVNFPFGDFALNPDYLGLLALLSVLHFVPLLAAAPFLKPETWRRSWPLIGLQALALILGALFMPFAIFSFCPLALIFAGMLLGGTRRFWLRATVPLLLAFAVGNWLAQYSHLEKQDFIRENLKIIFSSQSHYAKLVAREIVGELNSRETPFFSQFDKNKRNELAECWKNTLAARESIASGIYVVEADGNVLHAFSYQIPYIQLNKENIFPFWHVENVEADLFGKKVSLAVATINVFQRECYLGYIMVQVLNSADLILKSRDQVSLLTLDQRIKNAGIGYIKLDENRRILENPANINVENLASLLKFNNAWVRFSAMSIAYSGFVFADAAETLIIFFPENTFFKSFSEYIKILCFLLLLLAIFNIRGLRKFPWRSFFGSFSVKVFAILVLLSILTAAVFTLFALNFNFLSLETQRDQAIFDRGRSALNIINNLLAESGEISQNHLFLLEKILENNISVYENGILLFTSDHRKIIRSQLPIYLNSGIRRILQQNNQQFQLQKKENFLDLYFKTSGNYVFDIEFPFNSTDLLRARAYYIDFMVTVFFILIVIGMAAAFFFRNKILAPIHRLNRGMAEVQRGNLRPLAAIPVEAELRELYQGFNSMLGGIQEQKKNVSEISKMKTLVQLGRRVAHEVKNPLTPIRLSAEQILRSLQDGEGTDKPVIANAVRYIIEETEHLSRVAYGFLNLSKLDELKTGPFLLNDLIAEAISHMRSIYPHVRFTVCESRAAIGVVADRQKIKQVIDNVLTNALEAVAGKDGEIEVSLAQEGEEVEMRIRDNGTGISGEELERIAREEFSSKDLGTGLGLVIARRFLELHQGSLDIRSGPEAGTIIIMRFAKHVPQA